jgi:hypothetical protein
MISYYMGFRIGLRWPLYFGVGDSLKASCKWGWTKTWDFDLGIITVGITIFHNATAPLALDR